MFVAPSGKNFSGMGTDEDQDLENHDIADFAFTGHGFKSCGPISLGGHIPRPFSFTKISKRSRWQAARKSEVLL